MFCILENKWEYAYNGALYQMFMDFRNGYLKIRRKVFREYLLN
jgi:hypothetical protein